MARCPVCQSVRIVIGVSPTRKAFCTSCGARWVQEGSHQRGIRRGPSAVTTLPAQAER